MSTESSEQIAIFNYAQLKAQQQPEWGMLFAIPNGGHRNAVTAARLRREGVKRGVPDMCLPVPRKGYSGLWLELKATKGGRLSPEQRAWIDALNQLGYCAKVAKGAERAIETIEWYLS